MAGRSRCASLAAVLLLAGCADAKRGPVPDACRSDAATVVRALSAAPGNVRLAGGVHVSDCLRNATSDTELQNVGAVLVEAGGRIEARGMRDARVPLELGYLAGAVERGASGTGGVAAELVVRMQRFVGDAGDATPAAHAAFLRGRAAGRAGG